MYGEFDESRKSESKQVEISDFCLPQWEKSVLLCIYVTAIVN
jgi:hypothetical protein